MLRSEITAAAHRVLAAIDVSGVSSMLDSLRGPSDRVDPDAIFATFQKYQHEAAKFSAPEIALIKIFGLGPI
jgi:hypothetical protein